MNLHIADLTKRLNDYLARRTPPKGIGTDDRLKAEQINEYVAILRRFAPEGDRLNDWWRAFLAKLADESDTWAWPAPKDVARSAKAAGAETKSGERWHPDSVAINLTRLNEGQPIGEDWLWGRGAMRLEAAGASRVVLRERRLQLAQDMAQTYPEDVVRARLHELKVRHEEARASVDDIQRGHHEAKIPDKRATFLASVGDLIE